MFQEGMERHIRVSSMCRERASNLSSSETGGRRARVQDGSIASAARGLKEAKMPQKPTDDRALSLFFFRGVMTTSAMHALVLAPLFYFRAHEGAKGVRIA